MRASSHTQAGGSQQPFNSPPPLPPCLPACSPAGDSEKKICKAANLGADVICLDLEDAVAANRKDAARDIVSKVGTGAVAQAGGPGVRAGYTGATCTAATFLICIPHKAL